MRAIGLSHQVPDAEKAAQADYVLDNSGDIAALRAQVEALWPRLKAESNKSRRTCQYNRKGQLRDAIVPLQREL